MLRKLLLGIVFPLALLAPGCFFGGDDVEKVDAEDWVDDFCDATLDLDDAEFDAFSDYDDVLLDADDDGEEVREALEEYLDEYDAALDDFLEEVEAIGEPDIRDGGAIVDAIREFVEEEQDAIRATRRDLDDLDEEDEDLVEAVDDLFFDLEFTDLLPILEDADTRDADDIIDLIDEDDDCASFLFTS